MNGCRENQKSRHTQAHAVKVADLSSRWPAMCIHGDKSQPERDWVLAGTINTLTDISLYGRSLHCCVVLP